MPKAKDYSVIDWDSLVFYDETSPSCLRWKINEKYSGIRINDPVGYKHTRGYYVTEHKNLPYLLHRVIWILKYGAIDENLKIDHIDGNGLNNKIDNLRLVTQEVNGRNQSKRKDNKSGVSMVSYRINSAEHPYWCARWYEYSTGKLKSKFFSAIKFGDNEAKQMAIEYRFKMVEEQNEAGAGYTDRHGK